MSIHLQASVIAGILALSSFGAAYAQDSAQKQSSGRRIAMALPKAPPAAVVKPQAVPAAAKLSSDSKTAISAEIAKHPAYTKPSSSKQIPENVRAVLIDGAGKAEQLSRSYNRRLADLIVWIANSMVKPCSYTPAEAPYFRQQRAIEPQPLNHTEHNSGYIFQID